MKKIILTILLLLSVIPYGFSQEEETKRIEDYPMNFNQYMKSNWFISAGIGKAWKIGDVDGLYLKSTPIYEFSVGKWILPYIAFRVQYNYSAVRGTTTEANSFVNGDAAGTLNGNRSVLHGDVVFSVMNIIDGEYREDRFWDLKPFIGLGFVACYDEDTYYTKDNPIFGMLTSFSVSNSLAVNLELRCSPANAGHYGMTFDSRQRDRVVPLSASVNMTYKFKPRGWRVTAPYADYPELKVFEKNPYIPGIKETIVETVVETISDTVSVDRIVKEVHISPAIVFFEIDKYNITRRNKVRLKYVAELINSIETDQVFTITGYADVQTATKEHNWTLSQNRAKAVYNMLVKDFKVDPSKLEIDYKGGVDYMYYEDNTLSRCVIIQ
ncbi:MAG: OmpA family protein [Rikenellaceae bacterium]